MSYCTSACCLRCRRVKYLNLQSGEWVHQDGWRGCEPLPVDQAPQCASPVCSRPVERRQTGRRGRYCSANCRQAAYRDRTRQAAQAARRAAELAAARAARSLLWPQLETASLDASEICEAVLSYAAEEDEADRGALVLKLAELRGAVDVLECLALGYRRADELAAR